MTTIMIVHRSPTIKGFIEVTLQEFGMETMEADNGKKAIAMMQNFYPDLVITGTAMSEMNGFELCRWVKTELKEENIPVIICIDSSQEMDRYWAMRQGCDAVWEESFNQQDLILTVSKVLKERS